MKRVAIIGTAFIPRKLMEVEPLDIIVDDTHTQHVDFEIKNYRIDPVFIQNNKIRSKYKRNLKYRL